VQYLSAVSSPQADAARAEAEALIEVMQKVEFDPSEAKAENASATAVLKDIKKFVKPLNSLNKELDKKRKRIDDIKNKIQDLFTQIDNSMDTSIEANKIANQIRLELQLKLNSIRYSIKM